MAQLIEHEERHGNRDPNREHRHGVAYNDGITGISIRDGINRILVEERLRKRTGSREDLQAQHQDQHPEVLFTVAPEKTEHRYFFRGA